MIEELRNERIKKLNALRNLGYDPYPAVGNRTHPIGDALRDFVALTKRRRRITVSGRVVGLRNQGSLFFADLRDESGAIQFVVKKENLPDFSVFRDNLDIGDFLEGTGIPFKTKRGEKSIEVAKLRFLTKSLRPLPSQWHGLTDSETRLRKRYLDLLLNEELKELFRKKALFWGATRDFLTKQGFLEVETPILEAVPGGADAEPFVTHHNALDEDFYLRISLELYQKRLIVAGFEKVFEIGRIFRNEGIDAEHLQDYSQMEFYWAYADYHVLMKFVEKMYKTIIKSVFGTLKISLGKETIDWGKRWPMIDYCEAFQEANRINLKSARTQTLFERARQLNLNVEEGCGRGRLIDAIYKKTVRPSFVQPAFLVNHPVDVSPLAKRDPRHPDRVERFQVVACGSELGNGWSELNDPLDQRARFEEQAKLRAAGDKEAQMLDEDFVEALEYGMPPTAGFGFSERLFAVLADRPVREAVMFPSMRKKSV